jgi:hypothetical protein
MTLEELDNIFNAPNPREYSSHVIKEAAERRRMDAGGV